MIKSFAMSNYLISISNSDALSNGTIHDRRSKLKIKAFDLLTSGFVPSLGEKRFFVTAGSEKLAFETKGYKKHRELVILQMIAWYCLYLGLIEAQIHSSLPLAM
ncbi:MAG: hypothetical protein ACXVJD_11350 [Mucilaginibacter sp.]